MGCDIHYVVEFMAPASGTWVGLYHSDLVAVRTQARDRNYEFFGEIACVRGPSSRGHRPSGLPPDVSPLARHSFEHGRPQFHSASHLPATEFLDCWRTASADRIIDTSESEIEFKTLMEDVLGIRPEAGLLYRVVFWFDS